MTEKNPEHAQQNNHNSEMPICNVNVVCIHYTVLSTKVTALCNKRNLLNGVSMALLVF